MNKITYTTITLIIISAVLLALHNFIPKELVKILPILIGSLILLLLFITAIKQLFSKTAMHKLMAFPFLMITGFLGYMFVKMPIYPLLMNALIGEEYTINSEEMFSSMRLGFKVFNIGIWITVIPIFLLAFIMMKKTKGVDIDLSSFDLVKAKIVKGEYTDIVINGIRIYQVTLEVFHPEESIVVTKDLAIPYVHFEEGTDIMVYMKNKKVYMSIEGKIY